MGDVADDILSWDEMVDKCLGRAAAVLEASERHVCDVETGSEMAIAWQHLAKSWERRQRHAAVLDECMAGIEFEDDDDEESFIAEGAPHVG